MRCDSEFVRCADTSERSPLHPHDVLSCSGHRTWTRPRSLHARGCVWSGATLPSPASPALHVGHRGPRACSPFSAASARMSGSELLATQSARHFSQKTCEHDVCTAWPYSTRLQHILHVNSETMDSSVSTSDSGKPIVRGRVACERPGGPLRRGNAPEACDDERLPSPSTKNITR